MSPALHTARVAGSHRRRLSWRLGLEHTAGHHTRLQARPGALTRTPVGCDPETRGAVPRAGLGRCPRPTVRNHRRGSGDCHVAELWREQSALLSDWHRQHVDAKSELRLRVPLCVPCKADGHASIRLEGPSGHLVRPWDCGRQQLERMLTRQSKRCGCLSLMCSERGGAR